VTEEPNSVRYLLALIFPWLVFFTIGATLEGVVCLILQLSIIGWLPAVLWAWYATYQYNNGGKQLAEKLAEELERRKPK
jgi:uncharacterized membrane protein YqaE (UPF0057 family)